MSMDESSGLVEVLALEDGERVVCTGALVTDSCVVLHSEEIGWTAGDRYAVRVVGPGQTAAVYPVDDVQVVREPDAAPLVGLHLQDAVPGPYAPLAPLSTEATPDEAARAFRGLLAGQTPGDGQGNEDARRPLQNVLCILFGGNFCQTPDPDPSSEVLD
jgi:hypothetical protein